jgi:MoaA/NifB/PqqE/SkfB family radical SAM enzyme
MSKDYTKFIKEHGNYFCALPFTEICNSAQGNVQLCCFSKTIDNVDYENNLIDTWKNGKELNNIRKRLLNNQPVKECTRCYQYEKSGAYSMSKRINGSLKIEQNFPGSIKEIKQHGTLKLRTLDIKFGNKCNLACIMCDPGSSSLHVKEKEINPPTEEYQKLGIKASGNDKSFDKRNLDELLVQAPNLMRLKFTGGEPTLLDGFKEFIEKLSITPYAKNIEVMIVTNGTTDVTKWIETFSRFKLVEVNWSTDGIGDTFEYIRWPGKWDKTTNIVLILTSAIQLLNLNQLPKLLQYCEDANFDWFAPVLVMWPEPLQLSIAPTHIKQQVIKECLPYTQKGKRFSEVESFIKIIETSKDSYLTWNDTKKFLSYYDGVRNMSVKDMCAIYNEIENTLQGVAPL